MNINLKKKDKRLRLKNWINMINENFELFTNVIWVVN